MEDMRRNMLFQILDNNARERRNATFLFSYFVSTGKKKDWEGVYNLTIHGS